MQIKLLIVIGLFFLVSAVVYDENEAVPLIASKVFFITYLSQ